MGKIQKKLHEIYHEVIDELEQEVSCMCGGGLYDNYERLGFADEEEVEAWAMTEARRRFNG